MQNDFHATMKRLSRDYQSTIAIDYQRLLNDYHIATIERLSTMKPI